MEKAETYFDWTQICTCMVGRSEVRCLGAGLQKLQLMFVIREEMSWHCVAMALRIECWSTNLPCVFCGIVFRRCVSCCVDPALGCCRCVSGFVSPCLHCREGVSERLYVEAHMTRCQIFPNWIQTTSSLRKDCQRSPRVQWPRLSTTVSPPPRYKSEKDFMSTQGAALRTQ